MFYFKECYISFFKGLTIGKIVLWHLYIHAYIAWADEPYLCLSSIVFEGRELPLAHTLDTTALVDQLIKPFSTLILLTSCQG